MAQAKKKNTRQKSTKTKKKKRQSGLVKMAIDLTIIAICLIALFKWGVIGTFLYQFISLFIGYVTPFLLVFTIVFIIVRFITKQEDLPALTWAGGFFIVSGILLFLAIKEVSPDPVWEGIQDVKDNMIPILTNEQSTSSGLIGTLLLGIIGTFLSYPGCYFFSLIFIIVGIILIRFDYFNEKIENREPVEIHKPDITKIKEHFQKEEPVDEDIDEIEEVAPKKKSIFINLHEKKPKKEKNNGFFLEADDPKEKGSSYSNLNILDSNSRQNTKSSTSSFGSITADPYSESQPVFDILGENTNQKNLSSASNFRFIDVGEVYSDQIEQEKEYRKKTPPISEERQKTTFEPITLDPIPKKKRSKSNAVVKSAIEEDDEMADTLKIKRVSVKPTKEKSIEPKHYVDNHDEHYENYKLPKLNLLEEISRKNKNNLNASNAREQGQKLIAILQQFGVQANLVDIHVGPSVTKFEIKPELGVRVSKISGLQDDIKMALAAKDIRIEAPIPGKNAVGVEIPNAEKTTVQMKDLMRNVPVSLKEHKLVFCLGKDLTGNNCYGELNRMPHLLIAGATGSGKSVCVNSIISSILMRTKPDEVKLILIDPKKVEFTPYNDVPHLLAPVITDGDMANKALKVVVAMMDRRYDLFTEMGVRNITAYNNYVETHPDDNLHPMTSLVVIIDELADLMLVAAKEVESSIQRITQLARAAGIHLIVATQRPSVDVITGVIKANIPSRIAFAVSSAVDSRTILDQAGAERLLGNGDMLYLPNGETNPKRIQGVFITDDEVNRIAEYVKSQGKPQYDDSFIQLRSLQSQGGEVKPENADPLYPEVKNFVIQTRKASTSLIQRRFSVGYSRAARLIDVLESEGVIGPANGSKPREILIGNDPEGME